jgi:hypothetical protein
MKDDESRKKIRNEKVKNVSLRKHFGSHSQGCDLRNCRSNKKTFETYFLELESCVKCFGDGRDQVAQIAVVQGETLH